MAVDRPEASLPDAIERELATKAVAFVKRHGLLVGTLVYTVVCSGVILADVARAVTSVWSRQSAERALVEDLFEVFFLYPLFAANTVIATAALRLAAANSPMSPTIASTLVTVVAIVPWALLVLLSLYALARFCRRLVTYWK